MRAHAVVLGLLCVLAADSASAYTIVTRGGHELQARSAPEYRDGRAIFVTLSGSLAYLPEELVDKEATAAANEGLIQGDHAWKYEELTWWKDFSYREPDPPPPQLGLIAPGGNAKDSYDTTDLEDPDLALPATGATVDRDELERRIAAAQKLQRKLRSMYQELGEEIDRIETELASLQTAAEAQDASGEARIASGEARVARPEAERFELIPLDELQAETP